VRAGKPLVILAVGSAVAGIDRIGPLGLVLLALAS
jgi:hypothetical protein